jgi:DsbC/DsbD-like thiol-disulfide interchange protein
MKYLLPVLLIAVSLPAGVAAQKPSGRDVAAERAGSQVKEPSRHVTPHLDVATFLTDEAVAAGQRFSIVLDITPKPGTHVYAPGKHAYRVITLRLDPSAMLRTYPTKYPKSVEYFFEPLNERVQVYEQPFRLTQKVALTASPASRQSAQKPPLTVTLKGVLEYQACTDTICYPPEEVALTWAVTFKPQ